MKKSFLSIFGAVCLTGLLVSATPVSALLPPLFTSLNQYKMLLTSPQLTEKLEAGELIMDIQREDSGFVIRTNKSTLKVDIEQEKQQTPGPGRYTLNFHDAVPLDNVHNEKPAVGEDMTTEVIYEEETN